MYMKNHHQVAPRVGAWIETSPYQGQTVRI